MDNHNFVPQGWQCPICKRVYSPFTMMCYYCGGESKTFTDVKSSGYIDWQKQQSVTIAVYKPQDSNFTSAYNGYATYTAEDMRICDNCKHKPRLSSNNGTIEYSGACKNCVAKDMWENAKHETN